MDEMDIDTVDIGLELVECVQPLLLNSPVVFVAPIFDETLEIYQIRAVVPPCVRKLVGEACLCQPPLQVHQHTFRNLNLEGHNRCWFRTALRVSTLNNGEKCHQN